VVEAEPQRIIGRDAAYPADRMEQRLIEKTLARIAASESAIASL
jgi:hypothetical protein